MQPGVHEAAAGGRSPESRRDQGSGLRVVQQHHGAAVQGKNRSGDRQRASERASEVVDRAPAGSSGDRPEQRLVWQQRDRPRPQAPRSSVIGLGQPLAGQSQRSLAQYQPDSRRRAGVGDTFAGQTDPPQGPERRLGDHHVGGPLLELHQIRGEARRDRTLLVGLQPLDKTPNGTQALLKGEPGVPLEPGVGCRKPQRAIRYTHGRGPAAVHIEPAGRLDGVQEGDAQSGRQRRRPGLELDPLDDRVEAEQLAGGVKVEQLIRQPVVRQRRRETPPEGLPNLTRQIREGGQNKVTLLGLGVAHIRAAQLRVARRAVILPASDTFRRGCLRRLRASLRS